jgi:hypothetical protein
MATKKEETLTGSAPEIQRKVEAALLGRIVLVRDHMAGIHVGTLESVDVSAKSCVLKNARKVWYWSGAASCHGIAASGLDQDKSKIAPSVELVVSTNVVEIVLCTEAGAKSVLESPVWPAI